MPEGYILACHEYKDESSDRDNKEYSFGHASFKPIEASATDMEREVTKGDGVDGSVIGNGEGMASGEIGRGHGQVTGQALEQVQEVRRTEGKLKCRGEK